MSDKEEPAVQEKWVLRRTGRYSGKRTYSTAVRSSSVRLNNAKRFHTRLEALTFKNSMSSKFRPDYEAIEVWVYEDDIVIEKSDKTKTLTSVPLEDIKPVPYFHVPDNVVLQRQKVSDITVDRVEFYIHWTDDFGLNILQLGSGYLRKVRRRAKQDIVDSALLFNAKFPEDKDSNVEVLTWNDLGVKEGDYGSAIRTYFSRALGDFMLDSEILIDIVCYEDLPVQLTLRWPWLRDKIITDNEGPSEPRGI